METSSPLKIIMNTYLRKRAEEAAKQWSKCQFTDASISDDCRMSEDRISEDWISENWMSDDWMGVGMPFATINLNTNIGRRFAAIADPVTDLMTGQHVVVEMQ